MGKDEGLRILACLVEEEVGPAQIACGPAHRAADGIATANVFFIMCLIFNNVNSSCQRSILMKAREWAGTLMAESFTLNFIASGFTRSGCSRSL